MDFSKLKLELYDFIGVIFPGLLAISEAWILLKGWHGFVLAMPALSAAALTLLFVLAFGIGNIIQELGDVCLRLLKGRRYFQGARDRFWVTDEGQVVRDMINREVGKEISSVDAAFDYCLTKLGDHFAKREVFVATSDLCRSLVMLSALALLPAARIALCDMRPLSRSIWTFFIFVVVLGTISSLAWRRMLRFRELSEATVFRVYLAMNKRTENPPVA
jgi:hypothetical protein